MSFFSSMGTFFKENPEVISTGMQVTGSIVNNAITNGQSGVQSQNSGTGADPSMGLFAKIFGDIKVKADGEQLDQTKNLITQGIIGLVVVIGGILLYLGLKKK